MFTDHFIGLGVGDVSGFQTGDTNSIKKATSDKADVKKVKRTKGNAFIDFIDRVVDGATKAALDTWEGFKTNYDVGRKILGPTHPTFLINELLFNRDKIDEHFIEHIEFYQKIIQDPKGSFYHAIQMPKYIWSGIEEAWNRDVINGDVKSRTELWINLHRDRVTR